MISEIKRSCTKCGEKFPLSGFHNQPGGKYGKKSTCISCNTKALYDWRSKNKLRFMQHVWRYQVKKLYGITEEAYLAILEKQGGGCAVCGKTHSERLGKVMRLAIDHDHETGEVRGILCDSCNRGIGHLKTLQSLENAVMYLKRQMETKAGFVPSKLPPKPEPVKLPPSHP